MSFRLSVARRLASSVSCAISIALSTFSSNACADDVRPAAGIADNSFLIEEAYNQEAGVVQHISTLARQNDVWLFGFTQEWPIGTETHQLSYTLPYAWLPDSEGGGDGVGDVLINYRYQALTETATRPAIAPRVSLIVPTGDEDRGLGDGSVGAQANLPVSKIVSDRITLHANAGLTWFDDVNGRQPTSLHAGASAIYAVNRDINVLIEALYLREETVDAGGAIERADIFTLAPGMRGAVNFSDGSQLVLGVAAPIEFSKAGTGYGVFLYASFEHDFTRVSR